MSRFVKPPEEPDGSDKPSRPRGPRPGPSVYANRFQQSRNVVRIVTLGGQFLGHEIDGEFVPPQPCCDDPLECHKPQCWTRLQ